ncbi:MAG: hypothetical protein A2020_12945 [Lentisphaerae bacterium GWF2_45_14]|nr:MAG: hypothetical protein A2020_12945 [Lentisphaerae bacterium GWF2_45_14]
MGRSRRRLNKSFITGTSPHNVWQTGSMPPIMRVCNDMQSFFLLKKLVTGREAALKNFTASTGYMYYYQLLTQQIVILFLSGMLRRHPLLLLLVQF